MKVAYDPHTDIMTIRLRDVPVAESDEEKPGYIIDYDAEGRMVGIEILDASHNVTDASKVEFSVAVDPCQPVRLQHAPKVCINDASNAHARERR